MVSHVVVYRSEHLLWRDDQVRHLPDGHFEVHLRKFEQSAVLQGVCKLRAPDARWSF